MKVSVHIGMLNHKLSIPTLHHLVKLKVPEQPAESEQYVKSAVFLSVCNRLLKKWLEKNIAENGSY